MTAAQRGYPSTWMQAAATLAAAGPGECPQQQRVLACGAGGWAGAAGWCARAWDSRRA